MSHFQILQGDCRKVLKTLPDNSVDSIVTDPPYELGFMGKSWDSTGVANDKTMWVEALRVLKPGGHMVAFSGSRTYHRMTCAIEDAGFEVRDQIMWVYGSGFPKSHNISKALDKSAGVEREIVKQVKRSGKEKGVFGQMNGNNFITNPTAPEAKQWDGWGTALKPAHEPIVLARKPLDGTVAANVLKWGVGGLNIDGSRVGTEGGTAGAGAGAGARVFGNGLNGSFGKPVEGLGRFPANLIHDGSQQVLDLFPDSNGSGSARVLKRNKKSEENGWGLNQNESDEVVLSNAGSGSAARFFYCPKANKADRNEGCENLPDQEWKSEGAAISERENRPFNPSKNNHPTVKPTELMRYLCRLITPPNGTILDPFNGSGSTGKAAMLEGFNYIGIEMDEAYIAIATARINAAKTESLS